MFKNMFEFISKYKLYIVVFVQALASMYAICTQKILSTWASNGEETLSALCNKIVEAFMSIVILNKFTISVIFLLCYLVIYIYRKNINDKFDFRQTAFIKIYTLLFSLFMYVGDSFRDSNNISYSMENSIQFIITLCCISGYYFFFTSLFSMGLFCIKERDIYKKCTERNINFSVFFLFFILCWFPYLIGYFPGSIPHDGMTQINQYFGAYVLKNDHPIVSTLIMGKILGIFRSLFNDTISIYLFIILQTVFIACSFSYMMMYIYKKTHNKVFICACSLFLSVYPTWGMMVEALIKDTIYTGFFVLYFVSYTEVVTDIVDFNLKKKNYFIYFLSMLGMCFWRRNGIHIIVLSCIVFLCLKMKIKEKIKVFLPVILTTICYFSTLALVLQGVDSTSAIMYIKQQQTARYLLTYQQELSDDDIDILSKFGDIEQMKEMYNGNVADYEVRVWSKNNSEELLNDFNRVWYGMLKSHLFICLEATINNSYNYYSISDDKNFLREYQNYTKHEVNYCLGIEEKDYFPTIKTLLITWVDILNNIPILNLFSRCGLYTWIIIAVSFYLIYIGEYSKCAVGIPLYINILICTVSPCNGLQRYMWPVMATYIVYLSTIYMKTNRVTKKD